MILPLPIKTTQHTWELSAFAFDWELDWVISWESFDVWTLIWRWTYVMGFGIGLANISVHIYDDAYVLEFDNGKSMYWIWNWIRSYLLIFQGIDMFKNFEGVTSMYWIWNWIGSYLRSCKCLNMVHPCICLNIVHPCIVTY